MYEQKRQSLYSVSLLMGTIHSVTEFPHVVKLNPREPDRTTRPLHRWPPSPTTVSRTAQLLISQTICSAPHKGKSPYLESRTPDIYPRLPKQSNDGTCNRFQLLPSIVKDCKMAFRLSIQLSAHADTTSCNPLNYGPVYEEYRASPSRR